MFHHCAVNGVTLCNRKPAAYGRVMPRTSTPTKPSLPNMKVSEVAELLGVSRQHIYTLINDGQLTAYKVGAAIRIRLSDVEAALQRLGR